MFNDDPLFSPVTIGTMELKNRIVMPAMHLNYCPTGEVTDQLIEFYRARARGGVGLIIVGGCGIDRVGNNMGMIQLDDDCYLPRLQQLVAAIHSEGAKTITQLYQAGRYASSRFTGNQPVAPSPLPSKLTQEIPHELTGEEIKEMIQSFAQAAARTQQAGFDGVEILAGTGYLISEFLSPLTNKRTDEYGGDLPNRMRFALEVVAAIRKAVGPDFPLLARIAGHDFVPGGHTNTEARLFAKALEEAGVDAINVTGGWHETLVPQITMNVPPAAFRYLARGIKEAVSVPVIASNRITSPQLARDILTSGDADLVGMARPLLADPFLPLKAQGFDPSPIRPCVGCNQGCLDHVFRGTPVACLVNAEAGRETEPNEKPASSPKKVLVVGAGPAGLEFARVASLRGHDVTVWEKSNQLGGQINLAGAPPDRRDFHRFTDYLIQVCEAQGVKICRGQEATAENLLAGIEKEGWTDIAIATGALPMDPPFPVMEDAVITQAWDVLAGKETGQNVVIIGGGSVGVETALYLANQGTLDAETLRFLIINQAESIGTLTKLLCQGNKRVTLVEMTKGVGRDLGSSTRWAMLADLKRYQVKVLTHTMVKAVGPDGIRVKSPEGESLIPADMVVSAIGSVANQKLLMDLRDKLPAQVTLYPIGDVIKPAKVLDAVQSAYDVARKL
ncbi:NADH:flavin oxidoreductase [Desulfitobacterium dichloroeliminans LMG P-21439]|uniref:NADH:flavin oxidoreductase n=1 Tax=Desulfitobacterium dichloroeliminans (strain LMG P-21439 / DCA1) TaxID=871963 RepID=L0FBS1_DESDL|nr:FAD-dependent oxidoreductase [Desulfitobacterium dichloroeliminans]AGA70662.1 NADH:flavin oxidoreductase [Desulfitobacterium dichloroeliminans LMG P-21439]